MTTKHELTVKEAESWAAFEELLERVPEERRETPALEAGWSVKDVLWHMAYWWDDFGRAADRGWTDDEDDETDDVNAREQARSRALPYVEVEAELEDARARLLERWADVEEGDEKAFEWFVTETVEHYEEHVPQLRAIAEDPHVKARGA